MEGKRRPTKLELARRVEDGTRTPYSLERLQLALQAAFAAQVVGPPYRGDGVLSRQHSGETYRQMRELLLPGVLELFKKGYSKKQVKQFLGEKLESSASNRFIERLIMDAHEIYFRDAFGG
ncbi:MAG: hypothetical protein NZM04_00440 [Methylacidiphilales bacterium]|nr:hypothetical protein [Candidatus Methylacidiphilales bacterium]